jgi:hypothetical protein
VDVTSARQWIGEAADVVAVRAAQGWGILMDRARDAREQLAAVDWAERAEQMQSSLVTLRGRAQEQGLLFKDQGQFN